MKIRRSLLKSTVSVETYAGDGAYGPVYAAPVVVPCNVQMKRRLVRNANGDEYVLMPLLTVHPDDMAAFTPETRLTIDGRASTVTSVAPMTFRGKTSHAEVDCS
jgi:hypothetical protein